MKLSLANLVLVREMCVQIDCVCRLLRPICVLLSSSCCQSGDVLYRVKTRTDGLTISGILSRWPMFMWKEKSAVRRSNYQTCLKVTWEAMFCWTSMNDKQINPWNMWTTDLISWCIDQFHYISCTLASHSPTCSRCSWSGAKQLL